MRLAYLIKCEDTNFQWSRLAMNYGMLLVMVLIKLFRGPGGGKESVVGLQICDAWAWIAFAIHVIVAILMTAIAA